MREEPTVNANKKATPRQNYLFFKSWTMQLLNVGFALHSCVRGNSETIYNSRRKLFGQSTLNTQSGLADLPFLDLTSQKAHWIWKALEGTADGYQKKILRLKNKA
jgi:hypothetical protein